MKENLVKPNENSLTYEKYLKIDDLLSLQKVLAKPEEHDEMLFIIIHQVYELWFKQILHEVNLCCESLDQNHFQRFMHSLKRISTIQKTLIQQIDILETMPPDDFKRFRENLNPASGFQSYQFRVLEYKMGCKDPHYLQFFKHSPTALDVLNETIKKPTLYDHFFNFLSRKGYKVPKEVLHRDVEKPYQSNGDVTKLYKSIYEKPYENSEAYVALEALMDIDEQVTLWRYRHISMVKRIIGDVMGTGGSSGAAYLKTTLQKQFFPEIWEVRNLINN